MPEVKFNSAEGEQHGVTIVLDSEPDKAERTYQDTPLPFSDSGYHAREDILPDRLRRMRRLYQFSRDPAGDRTRNFYQQAVYMQDYEDDVPWSGYFFSYFPTYQDMNTRQLRGYFSWRAGVRRGEYQPVSTSAAYIYVYELLNGIGCSSPEESLRKLKDFEHGFLDSGIGDAGMRKNLRRWMTEFAVIHALPPEAAQQYADPNLLQQDTALIILRTPEEHTDDDLFSALCFFGGAKIAQSPVAAAEDGRGRQLFSAVWREAASEAHSGKDLFSLCFGERKKRRWYPLANAVYYQRNRYADTSYLLDEYRRFTCHHGIWEVDAYEKLYFDLTVIQGLLHAADLKLRRYLKTGRYLRERPEEKWALPYIESVIEADKKARIEASRPKITIDLSGLEQIRKDASATRDSLLTEEELFLEETFAETPDSAESSAGVPADFPLDAVQFRILHLLLLGESAKALIEAQHLTPSLAADQINEALYDEIGDIVLSCEDDELVLVEDYREDVERLFGEMQP